VWRLEIFTGTVRLLLPNLTLNMAHAPEFVPWLWGNLVMFVLVILPLAWLYRKSLGSSMGEARAVRA
jgi:hypothetical protein